MSTTNITYKARSEFAGTRDLVELAAAMHLFWFEEFKTSNVKPTWSFGMLSCREAKHFTGCAEGEFYSNLELEPLIKKMWDAVEFSEKFSHLDPHRVIQTIKPIEKYDGDYNEFCDALDPHISKEYKEYHKLI
jgi:hypothetical protein